MEEICGNKIIIEKELVKTEQKKIRPFGKGYINILSE